MKDVPQLLRGVLTVVFYVQGVGVVEMVLPGAVLHGEALVDLAVVEVVPLSDALESEVVVGGDDEHVVDERVESGLVEECAFHEGYLFFVLLCEPLPGVLPDGRVHDVVDGLGVGV